ncbi:TadE/TadG family type IV pilus assembly protein [Agromyces sp. NPDC058136]|uniref:TadE/TadG family type IV pilus assembly protein n=1 Tax=Agromyces sp. NPDC058136 TaxID=3346354 RepID=UPI0036DAA60A
MNQKKQGRERGAAAVEFALVLPLLLLVILGIFEFGRLFNIQLVVANSAREAARVMAIEDNVGTAKAAGVAATAGVLNPVLTVGDISITPGSCEDNPGMPVTATVNYETSLIVPGFWDLVTGDDFVIEGKGQMICGG